MNYQEFKASLGLHQQFDARYDNGNLVVRFADNDKWQRIQGSGLDEHDRRMAQRLANFDDDLGEETTATKWDPPLNIMPH